VAWTYSSEKDAAGFGEGDPRAVETGLVVALDALG
jgi:hypothetical protein